MYGWHAMTAMECEGWERWHKKLNESTGHSTHLHDTAKGGANVIIFTIGMEPGL